MNNTFRKAVSVILAAVMTATSFISVSAADVPAGLDNFTKRNEYTEGVFNDVSLTDWFHDNVSEVYELGLMNGKGAGRFDPSGNITVAETCTIAARLHSLFTYGTEEFEKSSPWYKVYVDYCAENGIRSGIGDIPEDLNEQASRGLFAAILRNAFPDDALNEKNYVPDGAIPDVDPGDEYAASIYALYRAGILTGSDRQGSFYPERSIRRSEVSAIITRMADLSLRQHVSLCEKTIFVSPDGNDETADGSEASPFGTLEAARDAVRSMDKSTCSGITVYLKAGDYHLDRSFELTAEDSGTEKCPVTYQGDGAVISGGVRIMPAEFEKAAGETLQRFPEEVRDDLVMYDLTKLGYTPEDVISAVSGSYNYSVKALLLYVDGKRMDLARFPNAGSGYGDGWLEIDEGYFLDQFGEYTDKIDNDHDPLHEAVETIIRYPSEYQDRFTSWSPEDRVFADAYLTFLWVSDAAPVLEIYGDRPEMKITYAGGYIPEKGGLFYLYNIPEELDVPGECFIDDNAVLYYYPDEDFDSSYISMPVLDTALVRSDGTDHINFRGITFEFCSGEGLSLKGNNITIYGCTVSDINEDGLDITGRDIVLENCELFSIGGTAVELDTEDNVSFESGVIIRNNYIHDCGALGTMEHGIEVSAGGALLSHNEVCNIKNMGVWIEGPYNVFEYNYLHDTCQFWTDAGALNVKGTSYGSVFRYNLIANTGYETALDVIGVAAIISDNGDGAEYYGNITYSCTGSAFCLADARDTTIHNNLAVRPGRYGIGATCPDYAQVLKGEWSGVHTVPSQLLTEEWQKAFPQIVGMYGTFNFESEDNSMYLMAPTADYSWDNYYYFDKSYRLVGLRGGNTTQLFDIEQYYELYSDLKVGDVQQDDLVLYSSRRSHYTLRECLDAANERYGVMTYDQLAQIGRIGIGIGDFEFDK